MILFGGWALVDRQFIVAPVNGGVSMWTSPLVPIVGAGHSGPVCSLQCQRSEYCLRTPPVGPLWYRVAGDADGGPDPSSTAGSVGDTPLSFGCFAVDRRVVFWRWGEGCPALAGNWGFRFQPSEVLKIAIPLMLASYLGKRSVPPQFKHVFFALLFILVPLVLVGMQPDLGTAILIGAAGFFALFLAGLPRRYLIFALLLAACLLPLMWFYLLYDYQRQRILTLFNPEADRLGAGWNIIQSTIAIGSGGVDGKGWTLGTQSQLDFLPEGHTDFIIAVLAEEFGLFGVMLLMTLYLLIISRCAFIGLRAQTMFGRLLAGSIALTFFVYIFVNMGMVSGILPVVGVPLPLVSYGGTSIVTLMLGFGMLMAVSTERKRSI